jgi:hypothetical protein
MQENRTRNHDLDKKHSASLRNIHKSSHKNEKRTGQDYFPALNPLLYQDDKREEDPIFDEIHEKVDSLDIQRVKCRIACACGAEELHAQLIYVVSENGNSTYQMKFVCQDGCSNRNADC